MLETLKIKHGSPEWLSFRKTGIGGSDAGAILGKSPFKTNVNVWEEKTGRKHPEDISSKPQVIYGKKAESLLVRLFEIDYPEYKVKIDNNKVYRRNFMFASLDAELTDKVGRRGFLETKTNEIHSSTDLQKWNNQIPEYYYAQVLHYFIVTGWDFAILKVQIKMNMPDGCVETTSKHYYFERAEILDDLRYLYTEEYKFWQYVLKNLRPPCKLPTFTKF